MSWIVVTVISCTVMLLEEFPTDVLNGVKVIYDVTPSIWIITGTSVRLLSLQMMKYDMTFVGLRVLHILKESVSEVINTFISLYRKHLRNKYV
jgi:hypothetical protein